jgi:hypothetical protein
MQDHSLQARGPAAETGVQYAALPPASRMWTPDDPLGGNYPAR